MQTNSFPRLRDLVCAPWFNRVTLPKWANWHIRCTDWAAVNPVKTPANIGESLNVGQMVKNSFLSHLNKVLESRRKVHGRLGNLLESEKLFDSCGSMGILSGLFGIFVI